MELHIEDIEKPEARAQFYLMADIYRSEMDEFSRRGLLAQKKLFALLETV